MAETRGGFYEQTCPHSGRRLFRTVDAGVRAKDAARGRGAWKTNAHGTAGDERPDVATAHDAARREGRAVEHGTRTKGGSSQDSKGEKSRPAGYQSGPQSRTACNAARKAGESSAFSGPQGRTAAGAGSLNRPISRQDNDTDSP